MVDIQSATVEIRRGKKEERKKKPQGKNIMVCPIPQKNKCVSKTHIPTYGALIRGLLFRLLGEPPLGQSSTKWETLIPDSRLVEQAPEVSRRYRVSE